MPLTSHNNILGWVEGLKINDNSIITGKSHNTPNPYPIIIHDPSIGQCWKNWNLADTGMLISAAIGGMLMAYPIARASSHSIIQCKVGFYRMSMLSWAYGLIFALRNSYNRLTGLSPNGLE